MKTIYLACALLLTGCSALKDTIIVNTDTALGFEVAQNQGTGLYQARFGYVRSELALVPTNGVDIITEIHFSNLLSLGGGSFYQRMAIGSNAVKNATPLFMKNRKGSYDVPAGEVLRALKPGS